MVQPSTMLSKSEGKQLVVSSEESDAKRSLGLKMHWSSSKGSTSILGYTLEPILYERTEKVLVHSHDLYSPKFALENSGTPRRDLQVKEVLETSTDPELRNWWFSFIDFILYSILQDDPKDTAAIKRKTLWFYYNTITRTLYRRSYDRILLHCLSHKEA